MFPLLQRPNGDSVADPGFPIGGAPTHWGGANLRHGHFLVKMYAKMKEIDPVGGGGRAAAPPLDPPMGVLCKQTFSHASLIIIDDFAFTRKILNCKRLIGANGGMSSSNYKGCSGMPQPSVTRNRQSPRPKRRNISCQVPRLLFLSYIL